MSDFGKGANVPSKDIVYRKDVEDMLQNALPSRGMWEIEGDVAKNAICETVVDLMMDLEKLPSAQLDADSRIERAIRVLQKNYNLALSRDYIQNPIAWALYETWKEFDR